jgi:tetratricopeptide (TPR) repeat protein
MPKSVCGPSRRSAVSSLFLVALALALAWLVAGLGCSRAPKKKPPVRKPAPVELCPGGVAEDPPRRDLEPGIRAFEAKKYAEAARLFEELFRLHPKGGSVLVWLGDAVFYDKDRNEDEAARSAIPHYEAAGKLHAEGCVLPRRPRYYQLIGVAYAALRLAKSADGSSAEMLEKAEKALAELESEFPTSAEVPYTQARLACLRAAQRVLTEVNEERCLERFKKTLSLSEGYERPRFLRTHRSTQDWVVRSETQSEFGPLRADPNYRRFIQSIVRSAE